MSLMKTRSDSGGYSTAGLSQNHSNKEHREDRRAFWSKKTEMSNLLNSLGKEWLNGYKMGMTRSDSVYSQSPGILFVFGNIPEYSRFIDGDNYGNLEKFITKSKSAAKLRKNSSKSSHSECYIEIANFMDSDEFLELSPTSRAWVRGLNSFHYDSISGDRFEESHILGRIPKEYKK